MGKTRPSTRVNQQSSVSLTQVKSGGKEGRVGDRQYREEGYGTETGEKRERAGGIVLKG